MKILKLLNYLIEVLVPDPEFEKEIWKSKHIMKSLLNRKLKFPNL